MYDNLLIYYFSGTGNAKHVAGWIADEARVQGLNTFVFAIDKLPDPIVPVVTGKTLIGICAPTHGFNFPPIVIDFLWKLPRIAEASAFLLNTRAGLKVFGVYTPGASGATQYLGALILLLKGVKLVGFRPIDLPSNWLSLHPALRGKRVEDIFAYWRNIVEKFAFKMLAGKKVYRGLYEWPIDLLLAPIALVYYLAGRFFLAKTFYASQACTNCGACSRQCPVKAISTLDNRPFWSYRCESCMRCMNHCPQNAIQTSHGLSILLWYLMVAILPAVVVNLALPYVQLDMEDNWLHYSAVMTVITMIGWLIILSSYYLTHWLLRFKGLNRVFTFTALTSYKFWGRYQISRYKMR